MRYLEVWYLVYYQFTNINWSYTRYRTSRYLITMQIWYVCVYVRSLYAPTKKSRFGGFPSSALEILQHGRLSWRWQSVIESDNRPQNYTTFGYYPCTRSFLLSQEPVVPGPACTGAGGPNKNRQNIKIYDFCYLGHLNLSGPRLYF